MLTKKILIMALILSLIASMSVWIIFPQPSKARFMSFYAEVPYGFYLYIFSPSLRNDTHPKPWLRIDSTKTLYGSFREGDTVQMIYVREVFLFDFEREYMHGFSDKRDSLPFFKVQVELWEYDIINSTQIGFSVDIPTYLP